MSRERQEKCPVCKGSGTKDGERCSCCGGSGRV
jgi:hypothetical protein